MWHATPADIGWLTSAVQAGFIAGTLAISLTGLADRFPASRIFVAGAIAGALGNAGFALLAHGIGAGMVWRFLVGLSLAGIYPVGMKLIVGWAPERTGAALAVLVGMLTLGTALPQGLRALGAGLLAWQGVILASSVLAVLAAAMIFVLGDGPMFRHRARVRAGTPRLGVLAAFGAPAFRAAMWGYFGHMWELYAFWTVVPLLIARTSLGVASGLGVPALAFAAIGAGALGCLAGGRLSRALGNARVALGALAISGLCGVVFALGWQVLPGAWLLALVLIWGAAVVADSPQFSALAARACPPELVGSALAIMNAIGFAITVVSIPLVSFALDHFGVGAVLLLAPGPACGLAGFALAARRAVPGQGLSAR
ncbi:MAG: MFS transporter [Rhodospirillales bacterium]|nr:MFS transporter [Rhodospirillales bacterium]